MKPSGLFEFARRLRERDAHFVLNRPGADDVVKVDRYLQMRPAQLAGTKPKLLTAGAVKAKA